MSTKLVDDLRAMPDEALGLLMQLRPDLAVPIPSDLSNLASRAQGRVSVARALDGLDQFQLEVLDGLRLVIDEQRSTTMDQLLALTSQSGVESALTRAAMTDLRARLLVHGSDHDLQLIKAINELLPPHIAGLGRPAAALDSEAAALVADAAALRRTVLSAPPAARAILDRLAAGPPLGSLSTKAGQDSAGAWLVRKHLLVPIAAEMVELPREVGLLLRRDAGPLGALHPRPATAQTQPRPGADNAGAGQAMEVVRHLEALLTLIAETPTPLLKSGGLGVRELRRLSKGAELSEAVAALLLEVAYEAGLLTHTDGLNRPEEPRWLPSPAFDTWLALPVAQRWARLARTWLTMPRAASLVGQRATGAAKDKTINSLTYDVTRITAPVLRRAALTALAALPEGTGLSAEAALDLLSWQSPRRLGRRTGAPAQTAHPALPGQGAVGHAAPEPAPPAAPDSAYALTQSALGEAALLGVIGLDALTVHGRALLEEANRPTSSDPLGINSPTRPPDQVAAAVAALLPPSVDHIFVQADLTVIVPGPPEPDLGAELNVIAQVESRGGAAVYRITPASIRRAFDTGLTRDDLHALLRRRCRTTLPQTLTYLIDDVARRHGGLRVGVVGCYLRCDDERLLDEVIADRRLVAFNLRRLAATVLVSPQSLARTLEALREAGYAPVAEDASGEAVLTRLKAARGPVSVAHRGLREDLEPPRLVGARLAGVIEQIRLGDRLVQAGRRSSLTRTTLASPDLPAPVNPSQQHADAMAVIAAALRDQAMIWVGFVNAHGDRAARLVRPISIGAGYLRAEDPRAETLHTFALHRITSADWPQ